MRSGVVALIGMVLALVFILIAFFGPWYSFSYSMGILGEGYADFGLTGVTAKMGDETKSISYDEAESLSTAGVDTDALGVFDHTLYITILALIFCIIALIGILMVWSNGTKMMQNVGMIGGIITFVFMLVAVIYFMISSFIEGDVGFWFSESIMGMEMSGGPGYAWYLMLVGAIIALVSSIMLFIKKPQTA